MKCNICNKNASLLFKATVLNKYDVSYYRCNVCDFIQTETPYWLDEAYEHAISPLDLGYIDRNIWFSSVTSSLITKNFNVMGKFLDFGGGYGMLARMMRDKGFDFYRYDLYCDNLFCLYFDYSDLEEDSKYKIELITAFEVMEHLENPLESLTHLFEQSDSILFSTELIPDSIISSTKDWWYFIPDVGQHISFYSMKTLEKIASIFSCNLYSKNNLHLLTKKNFRYNPLQYPLRLHGIKNKLFASKRSLQQKDFNFISRKLTE